MSYDLSGYFDLKPLVADFVSKAGDWLDVVDTGDFLTLFVGLLFVFVVAAAVWQLVTTAPSGS